MTRFEVYVFVGIVWVALMGSWALAVAWRLYESRLPKMAKPGSSMASLNKVPHDLQTHFGMEYSFRKQLMEQWTWTYTLEQDDNWRIEQICPTFTHDAKLVYQDSDNIVAYSDEKIYEYEGNVFNQISKILVKDSTGDTIYIVRSGNFFETLINSNKIWVTWQIKDKHDSKLLGYVEARDRGFDQSVKLKNAMGETEVVFTRQKLTLSEWKWEIQIVGTRLNDPRLISMMIAKFSFGQTSKRHDNDVCNSLFIFYCALVVFLWVLTFACTCCGVLKCYLG